MEIIIYSKNNCPNCLKAKNKLSKYQPKIIMLGKDISHKVFLEKFPNVKQVPQIVVNNKHIGDYEDIKRWLAFNVPEDDF